MGDASATSLAPTPMPPTASPSSVPTTSAPTALPTLALTDSPTVTTAVPTPSNPNCKNWCAGHTRSWGVKCAWSHSCDECSECDASATSLAPTPTPPTASPSSVPTTSAPTALPTLALTDSPTVTTAV